jgi:hypothetical protein
MPGWPTPAQSQSMTPVSVSLSQSVLPYQKSPWMNTFGRSGTRRSAD